MEPQKLSQHYKKFKVSERILLTGHSHQAWPDCALDAQIEAWNDAAQLVDDKWDKAFEKAARVRLGFSHLMNDKDGEYSLGPNTHELLIKWLSALPLKEKPRIITTDSEFYTIKRQLLRLKEIGLDIVFVPAHPVESLYLRIEKELNNKTSAVITSLVFFNSGIIAQNLDEIAKLCRANESEFLVDTYHALNIIPVSVKGLEDAYFLGGGYKYCQLGEGNCFLRYPRNSKLKPIITGWMADFSSLGDQITKASISYTGEGSLFAGATYDPVSHYRAARVFDFFIEQNLTPEILREISQKQIGFLADKIDRLNHTDLKRDQNIEIQNLAGFLALKTSRAKFICDELKKSQIHTDYRGDVLRLGPAPYVTFDQLDKAIRVISKMT